MPFGFSWTWICASSTVLWLLLSRLNRREHSLFRKAREAKSTKNRPYAFITGSSGGIGYAIAENLCRRGFNVIIHGRDKTRLATAVRTLMGSFPDVDVRSICFDAANALTSNGLTTEVTNMINELKHLDIQLLVNNVAVGFDPNNDTDFVPFESSSMKHAERTIDVNLRFLLYLTHDLLPTLKSNASKNNKASRSMIVNMSSYGEVGVPYVAVYSSTKAFLVTFTKCLDTELLMEGSPIDVRVVEPGDVDSPGHRTGVSLMFPSSDTVGKSIVNYLSDANCPIVIFPYWVHYLTTFLVAVQPYRLLQKGLAAEMKQRMARKRKGT